MRKIKVGVVGAGYLGEIHARIYKHLPQADLVAISDINPKRLKEIAEKLGVLGWCDYKELLGRVEAVSIAAPTILHYQIARDFLNHNVSVLVEKPFTTTLSQAKALIKLAKDKNLILQVGHIERFNPAFIAIRKIIRSPRFIECHRLSPFSNRSLDVGVVLDLMIHDIDIILALVNSKIKRIEAVGVNVLTPFEDIASARITFKNGCVCNLTSSRIAEETMRKIRIFFRNNYISLDYKNERAYLYQKRANRILKKELPIEKEPSLKGELVSFLECVAEHKKPLVSGIEATQALAVALQIQKKIWKRKS